VMSTLEFRPRLAALVPPPRLHLIRFHGVLAPNAKHRAEISPSGPVSVDAPSLDHGDAPPHSAPTRIGWTRQQPGVRYRHGTRPALWRPFSRLLKNSIYDAR
jgi:hypothetical protein